MFIQLTNDAGILRKDWRLIMQEQFDESIYKPMLKTKYGIWKIRQFVPKDDGFFYLACICDHCQMKTVIQATAVLSKKAYCRFCKAGKYEDE